MMRVLFIFAELFLLLTQSEAAMNTYFCNKYKPAPTDEAAMDPKSIIDASIFVEEVIEGSQVIENDLTVSRTDQKVRFKQYTPGKEKDFYAILDKDLLIENDKFDGYNANCTSSPLEGSNIAEQYNILDSNDKIVFNGMESMLSYTKATPYTFGGAATVRGMSAKHWFRCLWVNNDYETDLTLATDIYYSDEKVMPGNTGDALIRVVQNIIYPSGVTTQRQFDYFNFHDTVPDHLKDFDLPLDMYCKNRPDVFSMPQVPIMFQFSIEQIDLGDPNDLSSTFVPIFQFHQETYKYPFTFVDKEETIGDSRLSKFRHVTLQDFEIGLQYDTDLSTGSCLVHPINADTVAYVKTDLGNVRMKSPEEFFKMDIHTYHYMGQHTYSDRQIETDIYTSVATIDSTTVEQITIYLATKAWMKQYGFKDYFPMPITMKFIVVKNGNIDQKNVDFFQYAEEIELLNYFDTTNCFDQNNQMFLNIHTDVDYKKLSGSDVRNFNDAMFDFLDTKTKLAASTRIANPQVVIGDNGKTDFRFTLLDVSGLNKLGNSDQQLYNLASNKVLYNELVARINNGTFTFQVDLKTITFTARATGITKGYGNQDTFTARQGTATALKNLNSLYSGGAMAGLAFGMLFLGLLLGFGGFKGVKRVTSPADTDIRMQTLGEDR